MKTQKNTPPLVSGGVPGLGHALEFQKDRGKLLTRGYKEKGAVFSINLGISKAAVLIGPEYHKIFFDETDKKLNMSKAYGFLKALFGEVAFIAGPEAYRNQRPLLYEPFGRKKMMSYIQAMQLEIQAWIDQLDDEGEFEVVEEMIKITQYVAGHTLLGKDFHNTVGETFWRYYDDLGPALDPLLPPNLPLPKFIKRDKARKEMLKILKPVIDERRKNTIDYDDFLQDFVTKSLVDGTKADDQTILNLVLALMFAGHETTAGQAAWTIIQLLQHPKYLKMVQEEIDTHLQYGNVLDLKTVASLEKTYCAVEETSRMRPSADMTIRVAEEDFEVGGYVVPKDWAIFLSSETAHFLPELFENPDEYNPLRFAAPNSEKNQHPFSMIGFGGGTHRCAGMNFAYNEMIVITALMLQQLDMQLITKETSVLRGLGANRPTATTIRYKRKKISELVSDDTLKEAVSAGCPHLSKMAKAQNRSASK